jgi:hypothetical protein
MIASPRLPSASAARPGVPALARIPHRPASSGYGLFAVAVLLLLLCLAVAATPGLECIDAVVDFLAGFLRREGA